MLSKSEVQYEHPAKGPHHCSQCRHFKSPHSCEIVEGRIAPEDWCKKFMPYTEVMHKFKAGNLHSGSKSGPKVSNPKQAIAIMLSEKRAAKSGKSEYKPRGRKIGLKALMSR